MQLPFAAAAALPSLTGGAALGSIGGLGVLTGAGAGAGALTIGSTLPAMSAGTGGLFSAANSAIAAGNKMPGIGGLAAQALGGGKGGATKSFMDALLGTPKGIAALGQGVGALGQVAGMLIGGEKGREVARNAGIFGMIAGLAPDVAGAVESFTNPETGKQAADATNLEGIADQGLKIFN